MKSQMFPPGFSLLITSISYLLSRFGFPTRTAFFRTIHRCLRGGCRFGGSLVNADAVAAVILVDDRFRIARLRYTHRLPRLGAVCPTLIDGGYIAPTRLADNGPVAGGVALTDNGGVSLTFLHDGSFVAGAGLRNGGGVLGLNGGSGKKGRTK